MTAQPNLYEHSLGAVTMTDDIAKLTDSLPNDDKATLKDISSELWTTIFLFCDMLRSLTGEDAGSIAQAAANEFEKRFAIRRLGQETQS